MQQYILSKKNVIAIISGLLIALGFFSHFVLENVGLSEWSLIIASVFGITPIAIQAFQAMKVKVISIDVLVSIAAIGALFIQDYEESAIVTFLFLFGHYLEQRTLNQTRSAIKELTEMAPESALKQMDNGKFEEVEVDDVNEGDILLVKTGAKVPVDGTVLTGEGHINEASITGEAVPVNKLPDAEVFAGTAGRGRAAHTGSRRPGRNPEGARKRAESGGFGAGKGAGNYAGDIHAETRSGGADLAGAGRGCIAQSGRRPAANGKADRCVT